MLKKILLITLMIMVAAITAKHNSNRRFSESHYKSQFIEWMDQRQILYGSNDFQKRYDNFKSNVDYIAKWNEANRDTVLGLTDFADLSNYEYRQTYLGLDIDKTQQYFESTDKYDQIFVGDLPNHLDWRVQGAVSHVKDQGRCGSCWSFSTVGAIEGANFIATGKMTTLSEQQLVDCSKDYGNEGCNGGLMEPSFQYVIDNGGINTEEGYPYTATDTAACRYDSNSIGATMSAIGNVTNFSEDSLLRAVQQAPVAVAIDAGNRSFQLYKSGVYYEPACSTTRLSHAVLLVGYGEDLTSTHSQYWIVKNSWSTKWGNQGYIYMSRGSNMCGIASESSYAII
ncbi:hypothetical protein CYY_007625 [Polysphondylium violaceum]|uniref:Uncharacterized protein n=1 Tax=Polysphondylium violaceum TaxID=133409 RepID=A0A8J4PPD9_9MYCE|nr:hypothetical protein CYY_007625 [Polysphondylium violaceum]